MQTKIVATFFAWILFSVSADDCFDYGTDYYGFDMDDGHYNSQGSADLCQKECQATGGCEFWTWDPDYHSACWKKSAKGESRPSSNLVSGPKYCGDPPEPNPNQIRLMSYNLFGWNALHDPQKTENMFRIIRAFNPDILGVQESEREDEIASNIGSDYSVSDGKSQGHAIMYKKSLFNLDDFGNINLWTRGSIPISQRSPSSDGFTSKTRFSDDPYWRFKCI